MRVGHFKIHIGRCSVYALLLQGFLVQPAVAFDCGDGVIDALEFCDDGGLCEDGLTSCTLASASVDCSGLGSGQCIPRDGDGCSATCDFESGFTCDTNVSPTLCTDVDECFDRTDDCGFYAVCTNTVGGFTCACRPGYVGDGYLCTDVNECADPDLNDCHVYGRCINYSGGFNCACNAGFIGDGRTCTDIDECSFNTHNCDAVADCANTVGSFSCACPLGYEGDGYRNGTGCVDVDECADELDNCTDVNGSCDNSEGGFECLCEPGYVGDGTADGTGCEGRADVALMNIVDTPDPAVAGQRAPVTYEYTLSNYGPVMATGVILSVSLHHPSGATLLGSDGGCDVVGGSVQCSGPNGNGFDLPPGQNLTVTVDMGVEAVTVETVLDCTATVSGAQVDPDLGNNSMDSSTLLMAECGDGVVNDDEECDDGSANSDVDPDACRTDCMVATCGDGVIDSSEQCDDENDLTGDGCDAACQFEAGACCTADGCLELSLTECDAEDGAFFGTGTRCDDPDADLDGVRDECDVCPMGAFNDGDLDGLCEADDNCPMVANADQTDTDADGDGDACDDDDDGDGVLDLDDLCPLDHPQSYDADGDGCRDDLSDLDDVIAELGLPKGTSTALLQTVAAAQRAFDRGNTKAAQKQLSALLSKVLAMRGKKIPADDADMLIDYIKNLLAQWGS